MNIEVFKRKLQEKPTAIDFSETMAAIETLYNFTPTTFINGKIENKAGENSGSCKLFAFAKKQNLTKEETLACFGQYYFDDVLKDPKGEGHQNIRNFMNTGFQGLQFKSEALVEK